MYLFATGEPPFREWSFDKCLVMRVCEGLRPVMPDSAPEEYKKLAERCCDADPDKRPDARTLWEEICKLFEEVDEDNSNDNAWNTIYHNDVNPCHVWRRRVNILVHSYLLEICLNQETTMIRASYLHYQISAC